MKKREFFIVITLKKVDGFALYLGVTQFTPNVCLVLWQSLVLLPSLNFDNLYKWDRFPSLQIYHLLGHFLPFVLSLLLLKNFSNYSSTSPIRFSVM